MNAKRFISLSIVKARLDAEVARRNSAQELCAERPDPLLIAKTLNEPYGALLCALYGYGNARLIVKFLKSLPFELLDASESQIHQGLRTHYYRFQNAEDVIQSFITLRRLKLDADLNQTFIEAYQKEESLIEGLNALIAATLTCNAYDSRGYRFLFGAPVRKTRGNAPMKRWLMYLRWMVRRDHNDMGLFHGVHTKDLLIPLDTHTFNVSRHLGLLQRKTYDLQASIELTCKLREFDPEDPVKYDFALYRIGQEGIALF